MPISPGRDVIFSSSICNVRWPKACCSAACIVTTPLFVSWKRACWSQAKQNRFSERCAPSGTLLSQSQRNEQRSSNPLCKFPLLSCGGWRDEGGMLACGCNLHHANPSHLVIGVVMRDARLRLQPPSRQPVSSGDWCGDEGCPPQAGIPHHHTNHRERRRRERPVTNFQPQ